LRHCSQVLTRAYPTIIALPFMQHKICNKAANQGQSKCCKT
jgi:hypothetical protein